jgi:hypothetical protein
LYAVKSLGIAIVQDPKDSFAPAIPQSALRNVKVNHCVPLAKIGPLLVRLATTREIPKSNKALARDWLRAVHTKALGCPTPGEELWGVHLLGIS